MARWFPIIGIHVVLHMLALCYAESSLGIIAGCSPATLKGIQTIGRMLEWCCTHAVSWRSEGLSPWWVIIPYASVGSRRLWQKGQPVHKKFDTFPPKVPLCGLKHHPKLLQAGHNRSSWVLGQEAVKAHDVENHGETKGKRTPSLTRRNAQNLLWLLYVTSSPPKASWEWLNSCL